MCSSFFIHISSLCQLTEYYLIFYCHKKKFKYLRSINSDLVKSHKQEMVSLSPDSKEINNPFFEIQYNFAFVLPCLHKSLCLRLRLKKYFVRREPGAVKC